MSMVSGDASAARRRGQARAEGSVEYLTSGDSNHFSSQREGSLEGLLADAAERERHEPNVTGLGIRPVVGEPPGERVGSLRAADRGVF